MLSSSLCNGLVLRRWITAWLPCRMRHACRRSPLPSALCPPPSPFMLPIFFYGGQISKALESPSLSASQQVGSGGGCLGLLFEMGCGPIHLKTDLRVCACMLHRLPAQVAAASATAASSCARPSIPPLQVALTEIRSLLAWILMQVRGGQP